MELLILSKNIVAEDIENYLNKNQEFFHNFPELLKDLSIPHPKSGKEISLLEHQILKLREQKDILQIEVDTLKNIAGENGKLLHKVYQLADTLLACETEQLAIDAVYKIMHELFLVEHVAMVSWDVPRGNVSGITQLGLSQSWSMALKTRLESTEPVCGWLEDDWQKGLFHTNKSMESACILPLGEERIWGVLALGSTKNRFDPELGTYFLDVMGKMITQRLKRLFE